MGTGSPPPWGATADKGWGEPSPVGKKGAACLQDNIDNFTDGLIFPGTQTGKKTHTYFYNDIYTDDQGNITGDSIDLSPCDYMLSSEKEIPWEDILYDVVEVQNYEVL